MPPQLQALLENRNAMIAVGAAVLIAIAIMVFAAMNGGGGEQYLSDDQRTFVTVEGTGRAIEIQALLARSGIRVDRQEGDGGRSTLLFTDKTPVEHRDRALVTLVQSGLMDANVGLERFDKGDLTASSEDKRIRLIRAQQGELNRLIGQFNGIQKATVNISIPEKGIFRHQQKPLSASIQVKIPPGERLNRDVVRSIMNLVVGSIQGLSPDNVALSDTNGNTYNSVLNTSMELQDKLEEQDQYMKHKVARQLDKVFGPEKYVVTVSTYLREATKETMTQSYDPNTSAVSSKQSFAENLSTLAKDGGVVGATSSFIPKELNTVVTPDRLQRGYTRTGSEVAFQNSRTQSLETKMPGVIEDISIAVTVDNQRFVDTGFDLNQLKGLVAHAASPRVRADNVTILTVDFDQAGGASPFTSAEDGTASGGDGFNLDWFGWLPWAVISIGFVLLLMMILSMRGNRSNNDALEETKREIQQLRDLTYQQQEQIQAQQQQAQQLTKGQPQQITGTGDTISGGQVDQLKQTLEEVKEAVQEEEFDDEFDDQIKSWIESS